jgi:hypothetical protein
LGDREGRNKDHIQINRRAYAKPKDIKERLLWLQHRGEGGWFEREWRAGEILPILLY